MKFKTQPKYFIKNKIEKDKNFILRHKINFLNLIKIEIKVKQIISLIIEFHIQNIIIKYYINQICEYYLLTEFILILIKT